MTICNFFIVFKYKAIIQNAINTICYLFFNHNQTSSIYFIFDIKFMSYRNSFGYVLQEAAYYTVRHEEDVKDLLVDAKSFFFNGKLSKK